MRLTQLELHDFRNISCATLNFSGDRNFFLGANGQGKTNILEAIAYAHTLRSFRTLNREALVAIGASEAILRSTWQHEKLQQTTLGISLTPLKRSALLDGKNISTLQDILGLFPAVALSLADRELLYGGPGARRDEIDSLIAHIDPEYSRVMENYAVANKSRNSLLGQSYFSARDGIADVPSSNRQKLSEQFDAFESIMAAAARRIVKTRIRAVELLRPSFRAAFASFAPTGELPDIAYEPNAPFDKLPSLWRELRFAKDSAVGYTTRGPHRDGYQITLNGQPAEFYASEGQKFSIVLALKLAGLNFLYERLGVAPILICDDLLLELDAVRQEKFWGSVGPLQIFASGTVRPRGDWHIWNVTNGVIQLE